MNSVVPPHHCYTRVRSQNTDEVMSNDSVILTLHLATEAHDDDGLPHTLEHLVFMGSEDFPYKVL